MNPFETETMAELCLRQGHRDEALAIYTRLLSRAPDQTTRTRLEQRILALETAPPEQKAPVETTNWNPPESPLGTPGIRSQLTDDVAIVEWSLPTGTAGPTLQLLLVSRTPSGVTTETRSVPLDAATGRLVLSVPGLHSLRAAAGSTTSDRFIPLART